MDSAGYVQYEISNVARPGHHSRHNLKYWRDGEWVGVGCGAHSTRAGSRWKNLPSTEDYITTTMNGQSAAIDVRWLSQQERLEDALFTGLRLNVGVDLAVVNDRYGVDVWSEYGGELQHFLDQGILFYDGRLLRLTRAGMLLAHEIMAVFIR
jgi:oxygen-independent coproporphyrinogen-3 oxidase